MLSTGKQKKIYNEIGCFDWIKLIDLYWLVNIDWLAEMDVLDYLTW